MNSHNHIMYGTVDAWFYRSLAGIRIDPAGPGFRRIAVKPHPLGDLSHASATLKTVRGPLSSSWHRQAASITLDVTIPVNSEAEVSVPTLGLQQVTVKETGSLIWKDGSFLEGTRGISSGAQKEGYIAFSVGSGSYSFAMSGADKS